MTTLREAATLALAALDEAKNYTNCKAFSPTLTWECEEAITALRAALAEPTWCEIHQHHKWCEHNGGKMGPTGWEAP